MHVAEHGEEHVSAAVSFDAFNAATDALRAEIDRLVKKNHELECEVVRLGRENIEQLDTIFDLEQQRSKQREG